MDKTASNSTNVTGRYLKFDVVMEYVCPRCEAVETVDMDADDVYWSIEGGAETTCKVCGAELFLWGS